MDKVIVIALMGKAGAGKDSLLNFIVENEKSKFKKIISYTTRPIRDNETPDVDYHYVSNSKFFEMSLLEFTCFNNWYYGTGREDLVADKINIGAFNPEGVRSLLTHKDEIQVIPVYMAVSDKTRLIRQLTREENPNVGEIVRRYGADENDFIGIFSEFNPILLHNENISIEKVKDILFEELDSLGILS